MKMNSLTNFQTRLMLEGNCPERALSRLAKSGISVFHVKKTKKNRILFTVNNKDLEKVFAFYPNMCYNSIGGRGAYACRIVNAVGVYRLFSRVSRRAGALLGAALFLGGVVFADSLVWKIEQIGTDVYAREVKAVLSSHGVKQFSPYPKSRRKEMEAAILKLDGVSYCSIQKSGVTVRVEVRLSPFKTAQKKTGDMLADRGGTILSAAVLSGTLLSGQGKEVQAGEPLVGAWKESASGEKIPTLAMARVTLLSSYTALGDTEEEALANAYLYLGDGVKIVGTSYAPSSDGEKTAATVTYEYTQTWNF